MSVTCSGDNAMDSNIDLSKTHSELLSLMKMIHAILVENGVNYSLTGGSLIGAIRHNGFIPWDDDIDIMVDRENFTKMQRALENNSEIKVSRGYTLAPWLYRISGDSYSGSIVPMVDVFIMDNLPDSLFGRKVKLLKLRFLQGMLKQKIKYRDYSLGYKICIFITHVIGKLFSMKLKLKWYDSVSVRENKKVTESISLTNDSFGLLSKKYNSNILDEYVTHRFEDTELMITKRYDDYLTGRYGDYMTPPADNDRVPGHLERE